MIFDVVKRKCNEAGITLGELEAQCGIGFHTIYKWQKSEPKIGAVKRIADYFGCTVDDLLRSD